MAAQAVTVNLPMPLYERLSQRASNAHRSVEAELVDAVTIVLDEPSELPSELAEATSSLHLLDDSDLWRAARQSLSPERAAEIEEFHLKRQKVGLSASEVEALATLMKEYSRAMLVRARAAAVLKQRGHDVSSLLQADES